jgi:hypothetical protein
MPAAFGVINELGAKARSERVCKIGVHKDELVKQFRKRRFFTGNGGRALAQFFPKRICC